VLFQDIFLYIFYENSLRTISDRSIHLKHSPVRHLVKRGCITEGCIAFTVQVKTNKSMPHKTFPQRWFTGWKYFHSFSTEINPPPDPLRESIHDCRASKSLSFNSLWQRGVCYLWWFWDCLKVISTPYVIRYTGLCKRTLYKITGQEWMIALTRKMSCEWTEDNWWSGLGMFWSHCSAAHPAWKLWCWFPHRFKKCIVNALSSLSQSIFLIFWTDETVSSKGILPKNRLVIEHVSH